MIVENQKKIFKLKDGQVIYTNNIESIHTGVGVEYIDDASHIPDELFFDALANPTLYDYDHKKKELHRNKTKRREQQAPPRFVRNMLESNHG